MRETPGVEEQIQSFKSDLVKKTTSLKTVRDKFIERVDNRRTVLHKTGCFYEHVHKVGYVAYMTGSTRMLQMTSHLYVHTT